MTTTPPRPVRALVVSADSAPGTPLLRALQHDADIAVVGHATSGVGAEALVAHSDADVVIVDLDLADRSSQSAIERIMAIAPRPILVLSSSGDSRGSARLAALAAGAVDGFTRPVQWTEEHFSALRRSVRQVSRVHVIRHSRARSTGASSAVRAATVIVSGDSPVARTGSTGAVGSPVVGLAASTGGPSALATVLAGLAGLSAPVLVVQHLHADFDGGLLTWMARTSALPVCTAEHGQLARRGHVYLAPAGLHLRLAAGGRIELTALPANLHRPSADELFQSIADRAGPAGVGVIMTGMGDDGARGLLALHDRGGRTIGQDRASSAVFGMPQAAERIGAVTDLRPLTDLAAAIHRAVSEVCT